MTSIAITAETATIGTLVTFSPEFSASLAGAVWEIDGQVRVAHESEGGDEYVGIKARSANGKRWCYRLAYVSALLAV